MEPLEYLRILRRRWVLLALAALVGIAAGWITAPGTDKPLPPHFKATHTLILNPGVDVKKFNLAQASTIATNGAVPIAAADLLGFRNLDPAKLAKKVKASADDKIGTIDISASDNSPDRAVAIADAFAQALVSELSKDDLASYQASVDRLTKSAGDLKTQIDAFGPIDPATLDSTQRATLASLTNSYQLTLGQLTVINAQGAPPPPLTTLESARALPESGGFSAPRSKPGRAGVLGAFGLLVGIGLAFTAEKLEIRVVSKSTAERAFGLPVVAEIPPLPSGRKHSNELWTITRPAAPFVEAYRALRTVIVLSAMEKSPAGTNGNGAHGHPVGGQVILVTSPGAGDGKTTTAAHLAALLAESGSSVLVISADFRRPRIHELFGVEREPGLAEVVEPNSGLTLGSLNLATNVDGVKLLSSGAPVENPASLLAASSELIQAARKLFDFVVIDTAPLLVANDASELVRDADIVLLVARARRTGTDACGRAAEILERIESPTLGVVLVAASDTPTAYSYYRYRYYSDAGERRWWHKVLRRRQRSKGPKARATSPGPVAPPSRVRAPVAAPTSGAILAPRAPAPSSSPPPAPPAPPAPPPPSPSPTSEDAPAAFAAPAERAVEDESTHERPGTLVSELWQGYKEHR